MAEFCVDTSLTVCCCFMCFLCLQLHLRNSSPTELEIAAPGVLVGRSILSPMGQGCHLPREENVSSCNQIPSPNAGCCPCPGTSCSCGAVGKCFTHCCENKPFPLYLLPRGDRLAEPAAAWHGSVKHALWRAILTPRKWGNSLLMSSFSSDFFSLCLSPSFPEYWWKASMTAIMAFSSSDMVAVQS